MQPRALRAIFTRDDADMSGEAHWVGQYDVYDYLNADPRHAVVLVGVHDSKGERELSPQRFIIRGAGEGPHDFFWGLGVYEEPDDACGVDLAVFEAVEAALED